MKKHLNYIIYLQYIIQIFCIFETFVFSPNILPSPGLNSNGLIFGTPIFNTITFVLITLLILPISLFLIYKLLNIGRILFILHLIFLWLIAIDRGNNVMINYYLIDGMTNALYYLCNGAILYLIYFSALKNKFKYSLVKI